MVGSEQVYHSPVSQYGGSKPEVVNKNSEQLKPMVYLLFYTSYERNSNCYPQIFMCGHSTGVIAMIVSSEYVSGSQKSEMAALKIQLHKSQLIHNTHDSNENPTATPMFPGSSNTDRLLGIRFHVWACRKSQMAAMNRK